MIVRCPECRVTVNIPSYYVDFVHECVDVRVPIAAEEDVVVTGDWTDYTGSGTGLAKNIVQPLADKLQPSSDAKIDGEPRVPVYNARGNPADIVRSRSRLTYFKTK